jgi:hypothetical protein
MHFLPDAPLYTSIDECLAFLRALPEAAPGARIDPVPVHFFWQGEFTAKPALGLKSFFATQDLSRFACWLWLERADAVANAAANPHLAPFLPFLRIRHFDFATESAGTPFAEHAWVRATHLPVPRTDLARLAILHHHGGIYSDLDAVFLRDLGALLHLVGDAEFCFQWSYLPRGTQAFIRLQRHGATVRRLMESACRHRSGHPTSVLGFGRDSVDILVLPVAFFSPLWLQVDRKDRSAQAPFHRFDDFFRRFRWWFSRDRRITSHRDLFPGAFTYHWHGRWRAPEHRDSYAGVIAASLEAELHRRHPALDALPPYGGTR